MEVHEDIINHTCFIREKHDGQTYHMVFYLDDPTRDIYFVGVYLGIYSKKKQEESFENIIQETGKHPFFTIRWAKEAFDTLENYVIQREQGKHKKIIINLCWLDNRRRNVYWKVLSKKGYDWKVYGGRKCLAKEFIISDEKHSN